MRRLVALARRLRFVTVTPDTEMAYELTHGRKHVRLEPRERFSMLTTGIGFVVAATALLTLAPPGHVKPGLAVMLVVALAVMSRVELVLASGFAVPTQLVVVPILFLVPAAAAPPLIAVALVLGRAVDVVLGRRHPERLFVGLCDAWFSLGPAVVLVAAGVHGVHGDDWPWWLLAFGAQLGVDTLMSSISVWMVAGRWPRFHVRELAVVWLVDAALAPVGLLAAAVAVVSPAAILGVFPLAAMIAALAQERSYRIEQEVELSSAYQGVALLLGEVIEDDDHYTGEHSRGVVELSVEIAREIGMRDREQRLVEFGALLHDVGKLQVPNEIINKAGPLDDAELAIMRRHTIDGEAMLARVGGMMHEVGRIVRGSHEDWDGTGYPDGLAGEQIPLASRIVACADAYSAMTTDRSYRRALGHDKAVAELERCAGTQFDPDVVRAAIAVVGRGAPAPNEALLAARAVVAAAAA